VRIEGRWYAGPNGAPAVVLAPRGRGSDDSLAAVALEFQRRGFSALTFRLRDSIVANRERDSLRWVVLSSKWYGDGAAAFGYAREYRDSSSYVFGWGQGLGAAVILAGASRAPKRCDGLLLERLMSYVEDVMRENGTSVIPDAEDRQRRALRPADEPF